MKRQIYLLNRSSVVFMFSCAVVVIVV